jgi:predicted lipoprotein with Yx(FWY)xxD motif
MPRFIHGVATTGRRRMAWLIGLVALVSLIAACGGNGSSVGSDQTSGTAAGSGNVIGTAKTDLGTILVDSAGKTIYMFEADSNGKSACTGPCLSSWPIVKAPATVPSTVSGVSAKLGTLERPDGARQLTVDGRPVYTYAGDSKAGDTSGQGSNGFGALWWVLSPDGALITQAPTAPSTDGGYGGGAY